MQLVVSIQIKKNRTDTILMNKSKIGSTFTCFFNWTYIWKSFPIKNTILANCQNVFRIGFFSTSPHRNGMYLPTIFQIPPLIALVLNIKSIKSTISNSSTFNIYHEFAKEVKIQSTCLSAFCELCWSIAEMTILQVVVFD